MPGAVGDAGFGGCCRGCHLAPSPDRAAAVSQRGENDFDSHAQGEMASTTVKLEREAPESRTRAPACRLAETNTSRRRNNSVIRLASACNAPGVDLRRQGICQLSLQQHRQCHSALSGDEERWCNRCHRNAAERDAVAACRPEM